MATPAQFSTVAVIGNGLIGHGVAQVFATAGKDVRLIGRREESLRSAMDKIKGSLKSFADYGLVTPAAAKAALKRIRPTTDMNEAAAATLVVEAVPFVHALQLEVFEALDRICAPPTVLASSSGQVASELVLRVKRRERVVAAHFWYPSQHIPAVEVCAGPETAPDVVPWLCRVLEEVGKVPVVLNREIKGFIGNRMQMALLREAWALWASGAASAEMIDRVVRTSFGRRLAITGPIESADVGGLETLYNFAAWLLPDIDRASQPSLKVGELVKAGHKGPSTGQGVYDWTKRDAKALLAARMNELLRWLAVDQGTKGAKRKTAKPSGTKRSSAPRAGKRQAPKRSGRPARRRARGRR
ncbi:MAG: 3-hydroxyacyl-CoA dehydrogenase family protein [Alphaproteobacteria bacterium]